MMRWHTASSSLAVVTVVWLTLGAFGALGALSALVAPAHAGVVIPLTDAELIAGADVIVLGRVTGITSHADADGDVSTYITIGVEDRLKGAFWDPEVTIRESGGSVGDLHAWTTANPEFTLGERVLVFMDQRPDGTLRTYQFYLGKFTVVTDPASAEAVAVRAVPPLVSVRAPEAPGVRVPLGDIARHLDDFGRLIREHASDPPPPTTRPRPALPFRSAALPPTGPREDHQDFRLIGDPDPPAAPDPNQMEPRWLGPDGNSPVTMRIMPGGEPSAPSLGFDQVRAAFRAWGRVPTSAFRFAEGAPMTGGGGHVADGANSISFRDPLGQISNPAGCSGVLATTWVSWTFSPQTTVNGRTFGRMLEADLVVADGWTNCNFYQSFSNFAEVITHELGHALGLGHSEVTSADPVNLGGRSGATMNAFAHFDGRGAALHADDRAAVTFVYPGRTLTIQIAGSGTVASTVDGIACPGDCVAGFGPNTTVDLVVTPAQGSTFNGFVEAGCGTSVVMSANWTCTASFSAGPPTTFIDVPANHLFYSWIETAYTAGIMNECAQNPLRFCPDAGVTRAEMAVFLLKGIHGPGYQPPPPSGLFADVPFFAPSANWIEQLAREGITGGCASNPAQYCPDGIVLRAQMAIFVLRARHGGGYVPPPATGVFADVPASNVFAPWIEQLAREGITTGCTPTTFCPNSEITRGQMAVFLDRAFGL